MANGHAWTPDELATLRRMAGAGYSDGEVARHLERDRECVRRKRVELHIESGYRPEVYAANARLHLRRLLRAA